MEECAIRRRHSSKVNMYEISKKLDDFLKKEFNGEAYVKNIHFVEKQRGGIHEG